MVPCGAASGLDPAGGGLRRVLEEHTVTAVVISADGKTLVTGAWDKTARVWNAETGEQVRVLEGHTRSITVVAISADGKTVVTGSLDKTARVWSVDEGACEREGPIASFQAYVLDANRGHDAPPRPSMEVREQYGMRFIHAPGGVGFTLPSGATQVTIHGNVVAFARGRYVGIWRLMGA